MIESLIGDSRRRKYAPSPVFDSITNYYISPDAYVNWSSKGGDPLEFKRRVKEYLIWYVNQSVEPYVESLPFLKIELPEDMNKREEYVLSFDKNLQEFLDRRKTVKVTVHAKGVESYIVPLTAEEVKRKVRTKTNYTGGFEINLEHDSIQRMLTSFSHEVAHTYFYDISCDPPKCLVSNHVLGKREWYREFEGLAFDLGREILLPKKEFEKYVTAKYKSPSLENFLKMHSELKVSKEVLSQRLLRDLKLWKACIFWGKVSYKDLKIFDKRFPGPHIFVRHRDKRKGGFRNFSLTKELTDPNSNLRNTILEHIDREKIESRSITLRNKNYVLDIKSKELTNDEKWFISLLYVLV